MEHQDQKPIETLESQMPESTEKRQDKIYATHPYRAPQVFLIGKAKRLMRSNYQGTVWDARNFKAYP